MENTLLRRVLPTLCLAAGLALAGCGGGSSSGGGASGASTSGFSASSGGVTIQASPVANVAAGTAYSMQVSASAPAGTTVGYSIQNKPSWAAFNTASGQLAGTPSGADVGTYSNIVISATDGAGTATLPAFSVTVTPSGSTTGVARPAYNTGTGFFVLNGQLYDPNGNAFRIRGVNRVHWDSNSAAGMALAGANTVRTFIDFTLPAANNADLIQNQNIDYKEVPVVTYAGTGGGETLTSCSTDPNVLNAAVSAWVSQASTWTNLNSSMIINIANEWGPANSQDWQSAYTSAIAQLRAAGYTGPLMIDAGGCGQDLADLVNYASAVFNADPEKNIIFSLHMYGNASEALSGNWLQQLASLSQSAGMVFVVGEFGPGNNVGPSPTDVTPGQIVTAAESAGLGWMAWAWDDNDLANGASDNNWFSMTLQGPGIYTQPSDLTSYGQDMVLNSTYGIKALAKPASIFSSN